MENYYNLIVSMLKKVIELLLLLLVVGIIVGLVFGTDPFGVMSNIAKMTQEMTDKGIGAVLATVLIIFLYQRK